MNISCVCIKTNDNTFKRIRHCPKNCAWVLKDGEDGVEDWRRFSVIPCSPITMCKSSVNIQMNETKKKKEYQLR